MNDVQDVTTTADNGFRRFAKDGDVLRPWRVEMDAESVTLQVGTLEIQSGLFAGGGTFLADGKPLPPLKSICLRCDVAAEEDGGTGGVWKITAEIVPIKAKVK